MPINIKQPWKYITSLLKDKNNNELSRFISSLNAKEITHSLGHMSRKAQQELLTVLSPKDAAEIVEEIPDSQAVDIIMHLESDQAADIISEMHSDEKADLLLEFDVEDAEAIIAEMEPDEAEKVRQLIGYPHNTAGGLMVTEYLSFPESMTVKELTISLRGRADEFEGYNVMYLYITSDSGKFTGVLQIRDLLFALPTTKLGDIAINNVYSLHHSATLDEVTTFFEAFDFYGVPVIDHMQKLIGIVLRRSVLEANTDRITYEHLESQGIIGGDELRTMPILLRAKRRLSWLSVNIFLNIIAASVIAMNQDILSSVIALAVFLPIISDMSGCSGNQAVAVSMRELSLGVVKPVEVLRVWFQEISVGLINGLILGLLIGFAAWLWKGSIVLGLVVGGALALNTLVAVSIGGTVPLLLKRFGVDPALASGPILTTITDMLGFFLTLTFASLALSQINNL
jgi:magnesium transporter